LAAAHFNHSHQPSLPKQGELNKGFVGLVHWLESKFLTGGFSHVMYGAQTAAANRSNMSKFTSGIAGNGCMP
jgi:hypothetical protein